MPYPANSREMVVDVESIPNVLLLHILGFTCTCSLAALSSTSREWQLRVSREWAQWLCCKRFPHNPLQILIPPSVLWFSAKGHSEDDGRVVSVLEILSRFHDRWPTAWKFDIGGMESRLARLKNAALHLPADVTLFFLIGAKISGLSPVTGYLDDSDGATTFAFTLVWNTPQLFATVPGFPELRTLANDPATDIYSGTPGHVRSTLDREGVNVEGRNGFLQVAHASDNGYCIDNTIYVDETGALHMLHVADGGNTCSSVGFCRPTIDTEPVTFTWLLKRILDHLVAHPVEFVASDGMLALSLQSSLWEAIMEESGFDAPGIDYGC